MQVSQQKECIRQAQAGNRQVRDQFVQENMGLVYHIVKRFLGRGYEMEDLCQIGCIGLLKAIEHFDTNYDVRFSTYAVYLIQGEIRRFLRDDGMIKVSRTIKENGAKISQEKEKLWQRNQKEPTLAELAEATGLEKEEIVMAMEANAEVDSIDKEHYQTGGYEAMAPVGNQRNESEELMDKLLLEQLLDTLPSKDQMLLKLRYEKDMTQTEVAKRLQMNQVQVSRREKKILENLRKQILG